MSKLSILRSFLLALTIALATADFNTDIAVSWGGGRGKVLNGNLLQLSLDRSSGSGFQSRSEYLFGRIDMDIKLVPGNSECVFLWIMQLSSQGPAHDEIDFEFLGNATGEPYVLHTNVFSQGKGNREQQFYLWFDPRSDFHTYSILCSFYVDGTPIRVFRNTESTTGVPYLKSQPMRLYSSLWDAEDWATRGGLVKTDWSQAPFIASYRNLHADACIWSSGRSTCSASKSTWWDYSLDASAAQKLRWVHKNYMIYNYCSDTKRFAQGFPPECSQEIAPSILCSRGEKSFNQNKTGTFQLLQSPSGIFQPNLLLFLKL